MTLRLYHFLNQQYGIEAILKKRLKISRITELNDPFEMAGLSLKNKNDRAIWEKTKNDISKTNGLICMSKNWSNPLLWSHYSDRHRGICLGFDVDDNYFRNVDYRKTRISLHELGIKSLNEIKQDHMEKILYIKFEDWKYEDEYRAYTSIKDRDANSGLPFISFSESLKLKEIIVGISSDLSRKDVTTLIAAYQDNIECSKARLAFKSFGVTVQKSARLW